MVGGQSEDLGSMHIEEHAVCREEDEVCSNGKERCMWVESGGYGDGDVAGSVVVGRALLEVWGRERCLVQILHSRGREPV